MYAQAGHIVDTVVVDTEEDVVDAGVIVYVVVDGMTVDAGVAVYVVVVDGITGDVVVVVILVVVVVSFVVVSAGKKDTSFKYSRTSLELLFLSYGIDNSICSRILLSFQ